MTSENLPQVGSVTDDLLMSCFKLRFSMLQRIISLLNSTGVTKEQQFEGKGMGFALCQLGWVLILSVRMNLSCLVLTLVLLF